MRTLVLFATLLMLGAGCLPAGRQAPIAPIADDTPNSNPGNCEASGGSVVEGYCLCPEGYAPDPADFCLDGSGVPGGTLSPDNDIP